jgi:uncharacterized protein (TIGR00369 family)
MAETLASFGTNHAVHRDGKAALGASNHTNFLRPIGEGTITGDARRLHQGRTTWVWDVTFTDDQGRICSVSRVWIMVRPESNTRLRTPATGNGDQ